VTSLETNSSPKIVLAKLVVLVDGPKLHETKIVLWPRGRFEDILRRPEDQLGTPSSVAPDIEIVKVGLELGDSVGRGLDGRNTGVVPLLPQTAGFGVV